LSDKKEEIKHKKGQQTQEIILINKIHTRSFRIYLRERPESISRIIPVRR
jgi:hypothetical protein